MSAAALNALFAHNGLAHMSRARDWAGASSVVCEQLVIRLCTAFTLATLCVCLIEAFTSDVDNLMLVSALRCVCQSHTR
jgi:hypothetical protein